jgi:hypothetical protein
VVAWGDPSSGGSAPSGLEGVRAVYATRQAFAALKEDGTVQAWGDRAYGGSMYSSNVYRGVPKDLASVRTIYSCARAFAALKEDGTVEAWGNRELGGEGVPAGLGNVAAIFSTAGAFAALREDGSVVAWGGGANGGTGVPAGLSHVTTIYSTGIAFLAHREDGRLVAWGGDGGTVPANLDVVTSISATLHAFAAVTEQGTVVAWGDSRYGGSMTDVTVDGVLCTGVPAGLRGVLAIYSNLYAFAALRDDGTVHAWGDSRYGGVGVPATLRNVKSIFSTVFSFAALTNEDTVAAWGAAYTGGSMSNGKNYAGVPRDLAGVKTIFGMTKYYADSTARDLYPCPHNMYGRGFPNCTACPALGKPASQPLGRPGIRSDAGSCMGCGQSPGKYSTDGTTCGGSCPRGSQVTPYNWYGDTEERCFTCLPGSYHADGDCRLCTLGRYQSAKGQDSCDDCPAGRYTRSGEGSVECWACPMGKTVLAGRGYAASDCFKACPEGEYGSTEDDECRPCDSGSYSDSPTGVDSCNPCEAGTAQAAKRQSSCASCERGTWAGTRGATLCTACPPGSFCPVKGMKTPSKCPIGRYSDTESRLMCSLCPAGHFQNSTGSAKCLACPSGKYLDRDGANSSSACAPCPAGSYGDKGGLAECSRCPTGQVQPNEGQTSCSDCSLVSKIKTNNAAHTLCVNNPALLSTSVIELMFNKGVGLSLTFTVAVIFLGLAVAMHHMKEKYSSEANEEALADLNIQQVALKSALPGFSFGSEMVLLWGMMTEERGFGGTMLAFRMLHPLIIILLTCTLFVSDAAFMPERLRKMVRMSRLNQKFVRKNVAPVGLLVLTTGCDVTMLQLMPWEQSRFYEESMGYPCFDLMTVCMVVKTLQSFVSVICQAAYVMMNSDLSDPTMSIQARILFSLSIALSMVTLIMGVMTLTLKYALLRKVAEEEEEKKKKEEEEKAKKEAEARQTDASALEIGDLYANNDEEGATDSIQRVANPLHSAAMDTIAELREENSKLREELRQYRSSDIEDGIASEPPSERQRPALISPSIEEGATEGQL